MLNNVYNATQPRESNYFIISRVAIITVITIMMMMMMMMMVKLIIQIRLQTTSNLLVPQIQEQLYKYIYKNTKTFVVTD